MCGFTSGNWDRCTDRGGYDNPAPGGWSIRAFRAGRWGPRAHRGRASARKGRFEGKMGRCGSGSGPGHENAHDRSALTTVRCRGMRLGSSGSRDRAWGVTHLGRGVGSTSPRTLATPEEGRASGIRKAHYVALPWVGVTGCHWGASTMAPSLPR